MSRISLLLCGALVPLAATLPVGALSGCGASVSRGYESDVRFERCLSLDWTRNVRPTVRRACWDEWVVHFAAGQPLDRIDYAKAQVAALDGTAVATARPNLGALPEPTSVFSPVPMMVTLPTFGSAGPRASSSAGPARPPGPEHRSPCQAKCDRALEGCLSGCRTPVCEQFCAQKHGRCTPRCATKDGSKATP